MKEKKKGFPLESSVGTLKEKLFNISNAFSFGVFLFCC